MRLLSLYLGGRQIRNGLAQQYFNGAQLGHGEANLTAIMQTDGPARSSSKAVPHGERAQRLPCTTFVGTAVEGTFTDTAALGFGFRTSRTPPMTASTLCAS